MIDKKSTRLRRAKSARARIRKLAVPRLSVHRSGQHLYAQVIAADGETVLAAASTVQKAVNGGLKGTKNKSAAAATSCNAAPAKHASRSTRRSSAPCTVSAIAYWPSSGSRPGKPSCNRS